MVKRRGEHYKALEILSEHPEYIGIRKRDVFTASIEQRLFYRGQFYAEVDLVFELKGNRAIIVEYKSNGEKRLKEKGKSQLAKAVHFYEKIKKVPAEGRLITGDSYPQLRSGISNKKEKQNNYVNNFQLRKQKFTS